MKKSVKEGLKDVWHGMNITAAVIGWLALILAYAKYVF